MINKLMYVDSELVEVVTDEKVLDFVKEVDPVNLVIFLAFIVIMYFLISKQRNELSNLNEGIKTLNIFLEKESGKNDEKDKKYIEKISSVESNLNSNLDDVKYKISDDIKIVYSKVDNISDKLIEHDAKCLSNKTS